MLLTFNIGGINSCGCTDTCFCDYLEARQGVNENGSLIGRYCGKLYPSPVFSPLNQMWVKVTTNSQQSHGAVRAFYVAVSSSEGKKERK